MPNKKPNTEEPKKVVKNILPYDFEYEGKKIRITAKQKTFCDNYLLYHDRTQAVLSAYKISNSDLLSIKVDSQTKSEIIKKRDKAYFTVAAVATELLQNPKIWAYFNHFLGDGMANIRDRVRLKHISNVFSEEINGSNKALDMFYKKYDPYPQDSSDSDYKKEAASFFAAARARIENGN